MKRARHNLAKRNRLKARDAEFEAYETTDFGGFFRFLILTLITLGIYVAYHSWKRQRVDTNLLRSINSKLDQRKQP